MPSQTFTKLSPLNSLHLLFQSRQIQSFLDRFFNDRLFVGRRRARAGFGNAMAVFAVLGVEPAIALRRFPGPVG